MAKFTFDPFDRAECDTALQVIALFQDGATTAPTASTAAISTTPENRVDPAQEPAADAQPAPAADGELDTLGMPWNGDYHASTKTKKADGTWKMKSGCKEQLEAAIAAHKAAQTATVGAAMVAPTPAPVAEPAPAAAMPTPMPTPAPAPAAPAPTAPTAPVAYGDMATRFVGMIDAGTIADHNAMYADLAVNHATLQTNQTDINKIWHYMNALDAGAGHSDAVARALANAAIG